MSLAPGTKLGPYEILAPLGAGGMGEVYRAADPRLGRDVAIKVSAAQFSERFEREARAVAALNHANICTLFDVGPNYLVMELVEGPTLADRLAQGPIPMDEALRIAAQIAEALDAAHEKGITHRDLKPANIKIRPDGTVKVLDFGLAKVGTGPASSTEHSPTLTMGATLAGVILGTAGYMSPEQARGEPVDKRADIWAYGVVLHEMLTGKRLFDGKTVSDTLAAVLLKEPKLDDVPPKARRLIGACLERDPKRRLRDIGEAWRLLEEGPVPEATTAPAKARATWAPWAVAAVLLFALAALAFFHFRELPPSDHVLRYTIAPPETANVHSFAVSPDGRLVVLSAAVNGKRQLWLRPLDALQWQPMPSTEDARYPFWSPDSRNIGFFAEGKLRRIAAAGGPSQPVCDAVDGRGGTWSREDIILFSPSGAADGVIQRVPAAGGVPVQLTKAPSRYLFPTFLPDGRHFLYETSGISPEKNGIYFASLDGSESRRVLVDVSTGLFAPAVTANRSGYLLFFRENNLMAQPFDPERGQNAGDVFPVAEGVSLANANNYAPFTVSSNGMLFYWTGGGGGTGGNNQLVWYDRGGKVLERLGTPGNVLMPSLSPDEKTVAFSKATAANVGRDIWLRDLVRGNERRLTTDPAVNIVPSWEPKTAGRIFFSSNRVSHVDLYLRSSSGAGRDELLFSTPNNKIVDQWSRDGRFLIFQEQDPRSKFDLWYLPLAESRTAGASKPVPFLHSEFNEMMGQLSPDSRWMAYTSDVSGTREVYVQPFPSADNEIRISTAGGEQPRWRADGKELFYLGADGKITSVPITVTAGAKPAFTPGGPVPLFEAHSVSGNIQPYFNYDVSADGKRFLVAASLGVASPTGPAQPPLTVRVNWQPAPKP